jgi:hypothetical protein
VLFVYYRYFDALDVRRNETLDDVQFLSFITRGTDLSEAKAYGLFDIFDVDNSGGVDFDEFYLLGTLAGFFFFFFFFFSGYAFPKVGSDSHRSNAPSSLPRVCVCVCV